MLNNQIPLNNNIFIYKHIFIWRFKSFSEREMRIVYKSSVDGRPSHVLSYTIYTLPAVLMVELHTSWATQYTPFQQLLWRQCDVLSTVMVRWKRLVDRVVSVTEHSPVGPTSMVKVNYCITTHHSNLWHGTVCSKYNMLQILVISELYSDSYTWQNDPCPSLCPLPCPNLSPCP